MSEQRNAFWIPAGSFCLAVAISLLAGPSRRALAHRAPQSATNPCACAFQITGMSVTVTGANWKVSMPPGLSRGQMNFTANVDYLAQGESGSATYDIFFKGKVRNADGTTTDVDFTPSLGPNIARLDQGTDVTCDAQKPYNKVLPPGKLSAISLATGLRDMYGPFPPNDWPMKPNPSHKMEAQVIVSGHTTGQDGFKCPDSMSKTKAIHVTNGSFTTPFKSGQ